MLWSTYESEKAYEIRSRELDRQWRLLQKKEGKGEATKEKRVAPQSLACNCACSCNVAQA